MVASRSFERRVDALDEIVDFTARTFGEAGISRSLLPAVDFVIEELFTNMIKYGRGGAEVTIDIRAIARGVEVTILDEGPQLFDPRAASPVDVSAPLAQRRPGGLGLHLIWRMCDFVEYEHQPATRLNRITFRKMETSPPKP